MAIIHPPFGEHVVLVQRDNDSFRTTKNSEYLPFRNQPRIC